MKTFRYLTIAVLALVVAACSSDILPEQNAASHQGKGIPFTATISMRSSATRSVMTENSDNTISAAWKTGDALALVYEVSGQKQVTKATMTVLDDKSATITATIAEGVTAGSKVTLLYPYSAVGSDGAYKEDALIGQDGTLETIAENFDLCQGDGEFTLASNGTASLKADVTMASQIAIWKLSLTDGNSVLKTEQINVFKNGDEDNMLVNAILEDEAEATSVFYIAVPAISNARIDIQTNIDSNTYYYSKEGVTLAAGKYYQSKVTLLDMLHTPLTLEATENGTTIEVTNDTQKTFQYAKNGGEKTTVEGTNASISLNAGDIVQFYSTNPGLSSSGNSFKILPNKKTYVYGNIMSLIDDGTEGFANDKVIGAENALRYLFDAANIAFHDTKDLILPATTLTEECYYCMFKECSGLTRLPEKLLPATTLANRCYDGMFRKCSGLTSLPEKLLPATTLSTFCYSDMFCGCSGLTSLPEKLLPATTLAKRCYNGMFGSCTGLTTVLENLLPATKLVDECYWGMFYGCSSLEDAPKLPATELQSSCYTYMFYGCSSLEVAPTLPAPELKSACYLSMFEGCTKLSSVTCLATDIGTSTDICLYEWLKDAGTAATGEKKVYTKPTSSMVDGAWENDSDSGIPTGWTRVEVTE